MRATWDTQTTNTNNNMPQSPYIPSTDSGFATWLANFSTLLTASPGTYGLLSGEATAVAAQNTSYQAAFTAANDPSTRTPSTVAAKDSAKATALATVRPYAQQISRNPSVSPEDKTAIGVNIPNTARTPIPPPTTAPALSLVAAIHNQHTLAYRDTATPTSKAKPFGAIALELRGFVPGGTISGPDLAPEVGRFTKSPMNVATDPTNIGKAVTYYARWVTRSGPGGVSQAGPWSAPLSVTVI